MTNWLSDLDFRACFERLEWELQRLSARDQEWANARSRLRAKQDRMSRAERAFSFVYTSGVLEDLFRSLNNSLADDLQSLRLLRRDLRPSAISVLVPHMWDATGGDRVVRLVKRRELVDAANDFYATADPIDLSVLKNMGINDGRTVNVHHFEALWEGLCLSDAAESMWLTMQHRQAVVSLAEKRNAIAHFETDPRTEAFRFSYGDLHTLVRRVLDSVERLHEHCIVWLDRHAATPP